MKVYLDANVIIYGYEADEPLRSSVLKRIWHLCGGEDGGIVTSIFSRLECRVVPLHNGDAALLDDYEDFFTCPGVEIIDVSRDIIDLATSLRAQYGFKSPDAIHLATALHAGAQTVLTADVALRKCFQITVEVIDPASPDS